MQTSEASEAQGPVVATRRSRLPGALYVFEDRNYLLYWLSSFCYYSGFFTDLLTRGWLAFELTHSATKLGIVTVSQGVPTAIIAIIGGTMADRLPKKKLLIGSQIVLASTSVLLCLLIVSGAIQFWHLTTLSLLNGAAVGFSLPGRLSLVSEISTPEDFTEAYGLYYVALNTMKIGGPSLGGLLIAVSGAKGSYAAISAVHALSLFWLLLVRVHIEEVKAAGQSFVRDLAGTFSLAWKQPVLMHLMAAQLALTFFALSSVTLLPVFVSRVFHTGAGGLGELQAANGIGALIGSFGVASLRGFKRKGALLLLAGMVEAITWMLFSQQGAFVAGLSIMVLIGLAEGAYIALNSTLFQASAPSNMRGRAMSLYMTGQALQPLGVLPLSKAADSLGIQPAVMIAGALFLTHMTLVAVCFPSIRKLE